MKKAAPAALGALVLLLATACGGSDETTADTETVTTSVAKAISTPAAGSSPRTTPSAWPRSSSPSSAWRS